MTKETISSANNDREHDPHKPLTPELGQEIIRLKEQMEEYAAHLDDLCHNLERIKDAVFRAQEFAECLLTDDLSAAWNVIRRGREAFESGVEAENDLAGEDDLDRPLFD